MGCKFFNFVLAKGANHDQIHHAADDACTVFNGLSTAQLTIARREVHHRAAQLVHASFKAHTRSRGCFFKNHGQGAVGQWLVFFVSLEFCFDQCRPLEEVCVLFGVEIGEL